MKMPSCLPQSSPCSSPEMEHSCRRAVRLLTPANAISKRLRAIPDPGQALGRLTVSSAAQGRKPGKLLWDGLVAPALAKHSGTCFSGVVWWATHWMTVPGSFLPDHEFIPLLDHPNSLFLPMVTF